MRARGERNKPNLSPEYTKQLQQAYKQGMQVATMLDSAGWKVIEKYLSGFSETAKAKFMADDPEMSAAQYRATLQLVAWITDGVQAFVEQGRRAAQELRDNEIDPE